ncbi:MAG: 30S ribosomal protein S8 [Candidatus Pacebacteria bacterium]|nr:30S ribosomal protein S8 [Candidatus Paceibacterota bacterium]
MTMTDPIADMLTRIRNAQRANHKVVQMPSSKFKLELAKILKKEGYINDVVQHKKGFLITLEVVLKKNGENYAISKIQRISKPGQRKYVNKSEIKKVLGGYGISIISTSQGIMTNIQARDKGLGGEVVLEVC